MKILELFKGTGSFSKIAKARGHEIFTIDIDKKFNPDLCKDIMDLTIQEITCLFGEPDFIWASPPCTQYSKAKSRGVRDIKGANKIVLKTIEIIRKLEPKFWIIENPQTGLLKKQPFMLNLPFKDITYCKYGFPYRKQTRFWNNIIGWNPKPICKKDCKFLTPDKKKHIWSCGNARPKYLSGTETKHGIKKEDKYKIPPKLCLEILKVSEKDTNTKNGHR